MGHKLWKFMLNTLSCWGCGQLQQDCAKWPGGTWSAQVHMATEMPDFFLCGLSGALHSCSRRLQSEHCFLATEEVLSSATCSLTGENKMNEGIKGMRKHKESIFLRIRHWLWWCCWRKDDIIWPILHYNAQPLQNLPLFFPKVNQLQVRLQFSVCVLNSSVCILSVISVVTVTAFHIFLRPKEVGTSRQ